MSKKLRVSAETIPELRDFLAGADVDMGCRPVAVKRGDRYATEVISDDDELDGHWMTETAFTARDRSTKQEQWLFLRKK